MVAVATRPTALADAAARVGDRWSLQVIDALSDGPRRFGELDAAIDGIAPNILTARLRRLEADGVVASEPYSQRPRRLEYRLTEEGRELGGVIRLLASWGRGAEADARAPRHAACGTVVEARWYCPTCARVVDEDPAAELTWL